MGRGGKERLYSVHPSVSFTRNAVATLGEKTGRTLAEWVALVKLSGPSTEEERREWLKTEHQLGVSFAAWIAGCCEEVDGAIDEAGSYLKAAGEWVEEMFTGKKAALKPVFDAVMDAATALGRDVKACPCKTIVPLYRRHVFAQIKPTTNTRIDLGLALGSTPLSGPLTDTGGLAKKDRITRRIALMRVEDLDAEVLGWLKAAYDMDAS